MKKFLMIAVAAFGMLMTACSKDEVAQPVVEESTVTFTISTPELATRTHGDGLTATNLEYAVYNRADNALLFQGTATMSALKATVEIPFVNGMEYDVLFWADAPASPYTVDWVAKTVAYTYATALVGNSEAYDAFYAYVNDIPEITGPVTKTVELKRPFAQLNIITNDATEAAKSGVTVKDVKVVVEGAYTDFDLVNHKGLTKGTVTFGTAAAQTTTDVLAVNYLFPAAEKSLVDVEFTYTDVNGKLAAAGEVKEFATVPVQRNYKTNIIGSLLTSDGLFNIEIKPSFAIEEFYINEDGAAVVSSAEGLKAVAELINSVEGANDIDIVLDGDIDLSALTRAATSNWTPIGTPEEPYSGTFDGKGYSIKNLNIVETEAKEGKAYIGFFGYAKNVEIKNVVFENVNLNIACLDIDHSQGHIGAVAGSLEGTSTIENLTVKGDIFVESTVTANGASRVAVVAGGNSYGNVTMKNVHVIANDGSYLKANNNVGALAGQLQGVNVFENCSSNIDVTGTKFFAGGIIGLAAGDSKFVNCHTTGDVAVVAGREGRAHDQYRVGGIAGGWADNVKNPCVLENCSYTGKISGKNSDGSVANPLDYAGYVGRGYTLAGCQGSTVIINGVKYVQKYNTVDKAGIYDITDADGNTVVVVADATALDAIRTAVAEGETYENYIIQLTANIELTGEFKPIAPGTRSGKTAVGTGFKGVFDGKGYIISGLTITEGGKDNAVGLFGIIDGGEVKDTNFSDVNINVPNCENAGTVAGLLVNGGKVSGITVLSGSVKAKRGNGGIVGRMIVSGTIENCTNNAAMEATGGANVGGIVSAAYYTEEGSKMVVSNCTNNGSIKGAVGGVGGIVSLSAAEIINCTNTASVQAAGASVGGIVGEQQNAGSVKDCVNTGNVTNTAGGGTYGTGGIIGWIRYSGAVADYSRKEIIVVTGNTNRGSISGVVDAGGIVGTVYNLGYINENKNFAPTLVASSAAAGIVGNAQFNETPVGMNAANYVEVNNNISTTSLENMSGAYKALYVYDNSQGAHLVQEGNKNVE